MIGTCASNVIERCTVDGDSICSYNYGATGYCNN